MAIRTYDLFYHRFMANISGYIRGLTTVGVCVNLAIAMRYQINQTGRIMSSTRVVSVGRGNGIQEIIEEAKKVYGLDRDSDALRRIINDWKWSRENDSKSARLERIEQKIDTITILLSFSDQERDILKEARATLSEMEPT